MKYMQEKEYWEKFIDALHIGDFGQVPPKKEISLIAISIKIDDIKRRRYVVL